MALTFQYMKKRCNFGRQPQFCEQGPEMCDSIVVDKATHKQYMLRNPVHQLVQNTPVFSKHDVNTFRAEYCNSGAEHAEGGWPKDVNIHDPEATQRYRRKIEREDAYIHCVQNTSGKMEHYINQNNAIDMYGIYFNNMHAMPPQNKNSARTVNVFRDPAVYKRPVISICWQPDSHKFVATYLSVNMNRQPTAQLDCYIWDMENPNKPETIITTPHGLLDLRYNQKDTNVLAGALMNGQVGIWDRRIGGDATLTSAPHISHRDIVQNAIFNNSKSGQEFFSGSVDGAVKWWDVRNMDDIIDEIILEPVTTSNEKPSMARACGASILEFEATIPTRFMVGTENGLVLGGNRKGKTALEKLPVKYDAHLGSVKSLERNPNFLKNFLTVGDWTVKVWSEECKESPVLWSPPLRHKVTAGAWSPTRLSLLLLTQQNGKLTIWDWLRNQYEPELSAQLCEDPLTQVSIHEAGSMVACGAENGNIYMVELSNSLVYSDKHDKTLMTLMFERESKRERILEARLREIKLKMKQDAEGPSPTTSDHEMEAAIGDRDLAEATAEYFVQVKKELQQLMT